jgi:16S rRNA (guanine(527)-N(7))-methyltransferase RsmG
LTPKELEGYEAYFALLLEWNQKFSLVSRKSIVDAPVIHFADSLHICHLAEPFLKEPVGDLGSGAGFPGLVFAIRYPRLSITLYERSVKKLGFLRAVVEAMGLKNVILAEALPDRLHSGFFFARAVYPREELFQFLSSHLKAGARFVTNLGGDKISLPIPPGFTKLEELDYELPGKFGRRRLEVMERVPRGT